MGVVSEAVEEGCGELLVAEDFDPLGEGEVGGDDGRAALVAIGEQVEEQLAAGSIEGYEAELVEDDEVEAAVRLRRERGGGQRRVGRPESRRALPGQAARHPVTESLRCPR